MGFCVVGPCAHGDLEGPVMVPTDASVDDFMAAVPDERRRAEGLRLIEMMRDVTGEEPVMWGPSIVGFGSDTYQYDSGRQGIMPRAAFSPRKTQLTVYLVADYQERYGSLLGKLGPHKTGKTCLYLKRPDDVDQSVLKQLIVRSAKVSKS
jgi:hypothetical protein